jgi:hypothetical protein
MDVVFFYHKFSSFTLIFLQLQSVWTMHSLQLTSWIPKRLFLSSDCLTTAMNNSVLQQMTIKRYSRDWPHRQKIVRTTPDR